MATDSISVASDNTSVTTDILSVATNIKYVASDNISVATYNLTVHLHLLITFFINVKSNELIKLRNIVISHDFSDYYY